MSSAHGGVPPAQPRPPQRPRQAAKREWYENPVMVTATVVGAMAAVLALLVTVFVSGPSGDRDAPAEPRGQAPPPAGVGAPSATSTAPASAYVVLHSANTLVVPRPGPLCETSKVDLDEFTVDGPSTGEPGSRVDLHYVRCGTAGLQAAKAEYFGSAPNTQPTPEACERDARSKAVGAVEAADLTVRKSSFCVITTDHNVAWMFLTKKDGCDFSLGCRLTFRTVVWGMPS